MGFEEAVQGNPLLAAPSHAPLGHNLKRLPGDIAHPPPIAQAHFHRFAGIEQELDRSRVPVDVLSEAADSGESGRLIRRKVDGQSGGSWTPIPKESGHPFRGKVDTHPKEADQALCSDVGRWVSSIKLCFLWST